MRMNNKQKMFDNKQRFSFRKLTVGLTSVLLGLTFMTIATTNQVQAAEQSGTTQSAGTQTTGDSDALEKPAQPIHKDVDANISDSHVTQDQAVSSLSDGHDRQDLNNGKDTTNDGEVKPVASNSAVSNTGEQLTPKETPVNKNSLSTANNSESKVTANAVSKAVATGLNTDNPADQTNKVQSSNSTKVKIRSRRAVTPALTAQDVINWDAIQYQKQADGNVDITGWDIDKGGIDILLPNTWDFTQKGIISDGKKAEITAKVMRSIAEASNTKASAENKTYNVKISENGDGKLIAKDQNWSGIFDNSFSLGDESIKPSGTNLKSANLNNLNTSNVTNMSGMFANAISLQNLDVSTWDTHNVTDMSNMFHGVKTLQHLDISNWNTSNVTTMYSMFGNASSLQRLDVSKWNTSNVTRMMLMFSGTRSLQSLDASKWDTHNVTSMSYMFRGADSLQSLDVSNWDTSNVTNMRYMFRGAGSVDGLVITANNYQGTPVPGDSDTRKLAIISNVKDHFTDLNTWENRPKTLTVMVHDETTNTDYEETVELDTIAYDSPEALRNAIQEKLTAFKNSKTDETHVASDPILTNNPINLAQELNATYKMNIELGQVHIDPEHPVNPGEHINGTIDKTYPTGLTHNDLNKTVTREVTIIDQTGKKSTTTQTVTFTRGATVNTLTNKVTYDAWSENGKHTFDKIDVPTVTGYTASGKVPEIIVTPDTQSSKVDITYTPKEYTVYIFYGSGSDIPFMDREDFDNWASGKQGLAKPEIITGHYGESISIPIKKITRYHAYPEADYTKYKFGIDSVTGQELNWFGPNGKDLVDPVDPSDSNYERSTPRYIRVHYEKDSTNNGYNIAYVDTYGAVINRPDKLRGVSGEATNYTAPVIDGYTLTNPQDAPINFVDGTKDIFLVYKPQDVKVTYHYVDEKGKELAPSVVENNHFTGLTKIDEKTKQINGYSLVSTPKQRVVEDLKDLDLLFVYTANEAHQHIHYVDENGNDLVDPKDATGNDVKDGTVTGVTDETVNVPVPDGWDLIDNSDSTTTLTNPDTDGEVATKIVKIKHGTIVVDHTDPHNTGAPVDLNKPNGPKYDGVTDQDLNQDAIRKFVFYLPANTKAEDYGHTFTPTDQTKVTWDNTANTVTVTQTVGFYRDAIVDKITGKVVGYKAKDGTIIKLGTEHDHGWIPADKSNGRFEAITFKQIKGYTPNVKATGPKKSVNMMVKPALFRTAMFYNVSFFANATFEKPEEKEIPEKAGNQDVIPSNKTTGKDTEPAKYVPKDPIQNGKSDPVKPTDGKGASSNLPQMPDVKSDQETDTKLDDTNNKVDNTASATPSGSNDNTPSILVDNTSKSDATQKQETEQKTGEQKSIDNTEKVPAEKSVKKHTKKSVKKGVKKIAKVTENTSSVATPVSNAKANEAVSTIATIKVPDTKSGEKTLPQTGSEDDASLIALGLAMIAFSGFAGLLGSKKKRD